MPVYKFLPQVEAVIVTISNLLPRKRVGLRLLSKIRFHEKLPPILSFKRKALEFTFELLLTFFIYRRKYI